MQLLHELNCLGKTRSRKLATCDLALRATAALEVLYGSRITRFFLAVLTISTLKSH